MRVAVVGLGKMGTALARRLLDDGVEVVVWNRTATSADALVAAGALAVGDLAAVWHQSSAACVFLSDDDAVRSVCLGEGGLIPTAPAGALVVEMSTISPRLSLELAIHADQAGVGYLRCPVSGNPGVLVAGNLTLIVSGDRFAFREAEPLLERIGATVLYVGPGDEARTMKLAVNAMLAATAEALAEAVLLCESAGIDRDLALAVFSKSAIGSPFIAYKRQPLVERRYEATFTTAMLLKDLELAIQSGHDSGLTLPVAQLVAGLAASSCDEGLADLDFMALLAHLQGAAGRPTDVPLDVVP